MRRYEYEQHVVFQAGDNEYKKTGKTAKTIADYLEFADEDGLDFVSLQQVAMKPRSSLATQPEMGWLLILRRPVKVLNGRLAGIM